MHFSFGYDRGKTIQALRYHFISQNEIKLMMVAVNVFAIISAVLCYNKKIHPEPFLLSTVIWLLLMVSVWFVLPLTIYNKNETFKDTFHIQINPKDIRLTNAKGHVDWSYPMFAKWVESPHFFHLYFDSKSFFLIPKEGMGSQLEEELRQLLRDKVGK